MVDNLIDQGNLLSDRATEQLEMAIDRLDQSKIQP